MDHAPQDPEPQTPEPLHGRSVGDIEYRVASSEWRQGFRVPTGTALFGVTRAFQTFPGAAYDLVARFSPTKG